MLTVLTIDGKFGGPSFEPADLFEHGIGPEQEVAAVPKVSFGQISFGVVGIRLFGESFYRPNGCAIQLLARADVAIARCGRNDPTLARSASRLAANCNEVLRHRHDVV
jgi:hypothetical protein